jgi:hypothetical protein
MKKIYLLISMLVVSNIVVSQSLTALNVSNVVYGLPTDAVVQSVLEIQNAGPNTIDVACERTEISLVSGSSNSFCWGILCYPATTSLSTIPQTIDPGVIDNTFRGDYVPNGANGISTIQYRFFDVNDPFHGLGPDMSNSVTVSIDYDTQTVGIDNVNTKNTFLNVASNPGSSLIAVAYNVVGSSNNQLKVYNLLGNHVKSFNLNNNGTMVVSTSGLANGVYMFCLVASGKTLATKKFVVSK